MAGTSERVRTAGEIAAQKVIASIIYPGHAEKSRQNPRWWDTPASRYDPESGEPNPDDAVESGESPGESPGVGAG